MFDLEKGHEVVYTGMTWKVVNHDLGKALYTLKTDYNNEHGYIETSIPGMELLEHMLNQPRLENLAETLEHNEKYTIVKFSSIGGLIAFHFRYFSGEVREYAQYERAIHLEMKRKHQRLRRTLMIKPHDAMLIYRDWVTASVVLHDTSGFSTRLFDIAKERIVGEIAIDASEGWLCK